MKYSVHLPGDEHVLINFYRSPSRICMNGDGCFELLSQEGTTQGCPLAMAMYALALVPLSKQLQPLCKQVWYADDATGCDKFLQRFSSSSAAGRVERHWY